MSGHKQYKILRDRLNATPEGRAVIRAEEAILRDVLTISRMREQHGLASDEIADAWEIARGSDLACEAETDAYLKTIQRFVHALGGRLEITAVFPDQTITLPDREQRAPNDPPLQPSVTPNTESNGRP